VVRYCGDAVTGTGWARPYHIGSAENVHNVFRGQAEDVGVKVDAVVSVIVVYGEAVRPPPVQRLLTRCAFPQKALKLSHVTPSLPFINANYKRDNKEPKRGDPFGHTHGGNDRRSYR